MIMVYHLGKLSQDPENLSKRQKAWGKSLPESLGALQQRILHDQTPSGNMVTQVARGTYLHSKSVDIVGKYYAKSKTR